MVREVKVGWQCEECGFSYQEKELAEKCEAWCASKKSCNIEITKHAIRRQDQASQ